MEGKVGRKDDIINLIISRADEGKMGMWIANMSIPIENAAWILLRENESFLVPAKRKSFTSLWQ
jgi:hypothetical protein